MRVAANCVRHEKKNETGISLISLIITIIVIIILAAIVIFTGLNTPDRANFAKFVSEFSDFRTAVQQDYFAKKTKYALEGKTRSDAQIYYSIAMGQDALEDATADINKEPTVENIGQNQYSDATDKIKYISGEGNDSLNLGGLGIKGTYAYLIEDDRHVAGWKQDKKYYAPTEQHWITDEGDVFITPGYRVQEDGTEKWFVNETVSSDTAATGAGGITVSNVQILASSTGSEPAGTNLTNDGSVYVYITFDAVAADGTPATVTQTLPFAVNANGTYTFTITGGGKTKEYPVTISNFKEITIAEQVEVGDYVDYVANDGVYTTSGELTGYIPVQTLYTTKRIRTSNTGTATMDVVWRVIYKNETTGEVWISPGIVNTRNDVSGENVIDSRIYLQGFKGYMTGATELQNICRALYSNTTLGVEARCANLTDMNKICNQNPTFSQYYAYYPNTNFPSEYTDNSTTKDYTIDGQTFTGVTVRKASSDSHRFYIGNEYYENGIERIYCSGEQHYDSAAKKYYYTPTVEAPVIVCHTFLSYGIPYNLSGKSVVDVISYTRDSGWLASPCVIARNTYAEFNMRTAGSSALDCHTLYLSSVGTSMDRYGVLPLVSLGSTLKIDTSDTTKDGSTVEKAWHIIKK